MFHESVGIKACLPLVQCLCTNAKCPKEFKSNIKLVSLWFYLSILCHGVPASDCFLASEHKCASCHDFYHPVGDSCSANICTCQFGVANGIGSCNQNNTEECTVDGCDDFYHHNGSICEINTCQCPNGIPLKTSCPEHDKLLCTKCLQGYGLSEDTCLPYVQCTCINAQYAKVQQVKEANIGGLFVL